MAFPKFSFFGPDGMDAFRTVIGAKATASGDNAMASVKVTGVVSGDDVSGKVTAKAVAEDSDNGAAATASTSFVSTDPDIVVVKVEESNQAEDGSYADAISELTFESVDTDLSADDASLDASALVFGQDQDSWVESPTILVEELIPAADILIATDFA